MGQSHPPQKPALSSHFPRAVVPGKNRKGLLMLTPEGDAGQTASQSPCPRGVLKALLLDKTPSILRFGWRLFRQIAGPNVPKLKSMLSVRNIKTALSGMRSYEQGNSGILQTMHLKKFEKANNLPQPNANLALRPSARRRLSDFRKRPDPPKQRNAVQTILIRLT